MAKKIIILTFITLNIFAQSTELGSAEFSKVGTKYSFLNLSYIFGNSWFGIGSAIGDIYSFNKQIPFFREKYDYFWNQYIKDTVSNKYSLYTFFPLKLTFIPFAKSDDYGNEKLLKYFLQFSVSFCPWTTLGVKDISYRDDPRNISLTDVNLSLYYGWKFIYFFVRYGQLIYRIPSNTIKPTEDSDFSSISYDAFNAKDFYLSAGVTLGGHMVSWEKYLPDGLSASPLFYSSGVDLYDVIAWGKNKNTNKLLEVVQHKVRIKDDDPGVRRSAILLLGDCGDPKVTDLLVNIVNKDNDDLARINAVKALGNLNNTFALSVLSQLIFSQEKSLSVPALGSLLKFNHDSIIDKIISKCLEEYTNDIERDLCIKILKKYDYKSIPSLLSKFYTHRTISLNPKFFFSIIPNKDCSLLLITCEKDTFKIFNPDLCNDLMKRATVPTRIGGDWGVSSSRYDEWSKRADQQRLKELYGSRTPLEVLEEKLSDFIYSSTLKDSINYYFANIFGNHDIISSIKFKVKDVSKQSFSFRLYDYSQPPYPKVYTIPNSYIGIDYIYEISLNMIPYILFKITDQKFGNNRNSWTEWYERTKLKK